LRWERLATWPDCGSAWDTARCWLPLLRSASGIGWVLLGVAALIIIKDVV